VELPEDFLYTEDHEWVSVEDDVCTVGITEFGQTELSDVVYVDLPDIGTAVGQSEPCCSIEAIGSVADLRAPIDGTIVDINMDLESHPEWVNEHPYVDGWIVRIELSDPSQLESLMSATDYREMIE